VSDLSGFQALPTDRDGDTATFGNHPQDHNRVHGAVNAVVELLAGDVTDGAATLAARLAADRQAARDYADSQLLAAATGAVVVHHQDAAAATWVIDHALASPTPTVTATDSSGRVLDGDVTYPTPTRVQIAFSHALIGRVELRHV